MAERISLKSWNTSNNHSRNFKMSSKYTDLGSPDSKKSILGVILNISIEDESTSSAPSVFQFSVLYRTSLNESFKTLTNFSNYSGSGHSNKGAIEHIKYLPRPLTNLSHIQLQIKGIQVRGDIGINDIGLIFRDYRSSSVVNLNED